MDSEPNCNGCRAVLCQCLAQEVTVPSMYPAILLAGFTGALVAATRKISVRGPSKITWRPTRNRRGRRGGVLSSPALRTLGQFWLMAPSSLPPHYVCPTQKDGQTDVHVQTAGRFVHPQDKKSFGFDLDIHAYGHWRPLKGHWALDIVRDPMHYPLYPFGGPDKGKRYFEALIDESAPPLSASVTGAVSQFSRNPTGPK